MSAAWWQKTPAETWRLSRFLSGIDRYRLDDPAFRRQVVMILVAHSYTGDSVRMVRDTFERVFMELAADVDRARYSEGVTPEAAQKIAGTDARLDERHYRT